MFTDACLSHEYEIKRRKDGNSHLENDDPSEPLRDFGDKTKCWGMVPTGKYLKHVYKIHHAPIHAHLLKEEKKGWAKHCIGMFLTKRQSIYASIENDQCSKVQ